mgnify:CR=1 FL=1
MIAVEAPPFELPEKLGGPFAGVGLRARGVDDQRRATAPLDLQRPVEGGAVGKVLLDVG